MANQNFYKITSIKLLRKSQRYFPKAKVEIVSHHMCHAYSSVFSCDHNEGSFITLDNAGSVLFDTTGNILLVRTTSFGYFNKEKGIFKYYPGIPMTNNLETTIGYGHIISTPKWYKNQFNLLILSIVRLSVVRYGLSAYGNTKELKKDWRFI